MDRRTLLKTTGMAALGIGLGGCASRGPATRTGGLLPHADRPAPVRVSWDRVIRTVVGLRPYRPAGFRLESERFDEKTIIHNYGHGGAGVSLSWGTAHLAADEALETGERRAAVLGCGAVGLATARLLQRRGLDVTIYAKDLPPGTTSNIAPAGFTPAASVVDPDLRTPEFDARLTRAAHLAYQHLQELVGDHYGVRWLDQYSISDVAQEPMRTGALLAEFQPDAVVLAEGEHPFPRRYATRRAVMMVETPIYLDALLRDFVIFGGRFAVRHFDGVDAVLSLPERLVINCTGLGAREMFGDETLSPLKGQLTLVLPQSEIDYILLEGGLYMMPRRDGILLGGTREPDIWTLDPNEAAIERIVEGHIRVFSAMSGPAGHRAPQGAAGRPRAGRPVPARAITTAERTLEEKGL